MNVSIWKKAKLVHGIVLAASIFTLAGCARNITAFWKEEAATRIAVPANLHRREVAADPFSITIFERVYSSSKPATIYIEGDGKAWLSKTRPSLNPTPDNPVALHLASRDLSDNVIYIARPCQFSGMLGAEQPTCSDVSYWTDGRFSLEVMQSMNTVLDKLKARHDIRGFNLVGYSGGAAVAALLAAKRDDVLSLRTVAGNLDHVTLHNNHKVSQMPHSLNPRDFAADIANIPQHHFVGAWDETVDRSVYDSFRAAMGDSTCVRMDIVDEVNHEEGWVKFWPALLKEPVDCKVAE